MNYSFKKESSGILLVVILLFISFISAFTLPSFAQESNFKTKTLDVNIVSNGDNTYDITEKWTLDFTAPSHGFYRTIPTEGEIKLRRDGKLLTQEVAEKVKNVIVDGAPFEVIHKGGNEIIKIGNKNQLVEGINEYTVSYRLEVSKSKFKNFDYLYQELKPQNWPTDIENYSVTLTLPKKIKTSSLKIYSGIGNSKENKFLKGKVQNINGSTVYTAKAENLPVGSVATAFAYLPKGYFAELPGYKFSTGIFIVTSVFLVIISFFIWFKFGKDPIITKTVEFYPPDDMDPMTMNFKIERSINEKAIVAEIVYMADKGYLDIEAVGEGKQPDDFILHRKKDPVDDEKSTVKRIYKIIFPGDRRSYSLKNSDGKTGSALYDMMRIISGRFESESRDVDYSSKSKIMKVIMEFVTVLVPIIPISVMIALVPCNDIVYVFAIFAVIFIVCGLMIAVYITNKKNVLSVKNKKILSIMYIFLELMAVISLYNMTLQGLNNKGTGVLLGSSVIIATLFTRYTDKLTVKGAETVGRILGFKEFLETAESDKLNRLVEENPKYFFNILPYTYIFGISEKWIKMINNKMDISPDWYINNGNFVFDYIFFSYMASSFNDAFVSNLADEIGGSIGSSGGDFGGSGGFGGGGFGGGGGGSW